MANNNGWEHECDGLSELLQSDNRLNEYFNGLPDYAKDMIAQRAQNIRTEDDLRSYADNILQGDK